MMALSVSPVTTLVTNGFKILTQGITSMLEIELVAGMLGVAVACFVGKKAIRLIKAR